MGDEVKVPTFMVTAALAILIALHGWTLAEIVSLKVRVAELTVKLEQYQTREKL